MRYNREERWLEEREYRVKVLRKNDLLCAGGCVCVCVHRYVSTYVRTDR